MVELRVFTPPQASDKNRERVVAAVKEVLKDAEAGTIDTVFIITKRPDGFWCHERAGNAFTTDTVAHLEIVKNELINDYLEDLKRK